jgi:hypothetical protein
MDEVWRVFCCKQSYELSNNIKHRSEYVFVLILIKLH